MRRARRDKLDQVLALFPHEIEGQLRSMIRTDMGAQQRNMIATKLLDQVCATRAGCVQLRFCRRGSGPLVGVYSSDEAEMDSALPWTVICEDHGTMIGAITRSDALSTSSDTFNFCDDCRAKP